MIEHQGIWLPDGETHFQEWMDQNGEIIGGRGTYQIKKLRRALEFVKGFRVAIDVGAHVGLWSMRMAERFQAVHAFEPVEDFRECFRLNVPKRSDGGVVELYPFALGDDVGVVNMQREIWDSGGTHVQKTGAGPSAFLRRLDDFNIQDVDFVKIDCEGYEAEVIKGGRATLQRCRPVVIVEQKPKKLQQNYRINGQPAVDLLRDMGAFVRAELSGDFILSWD